MQFVRRIGIATARFAALSLAISMASPVCANPAQAWTYKTLYEFTGGADGGTPDGTLLRDETTGDLFGVTSWGGDRQCATLGCGVVFKLTSDGQLIVLHTFKNIEDGANPGGGLVRDDSGNLYGTAAGGIKHCSVNTQPCGIVFKLTPNGSYSVLHAFDARVDGSAPEGPLIRDPVTGDLYGGAAGPGEKGGIVYKLTTTGKFRVLQSLKKLPFSLVRDTAGNLYGTTRDGGDPICQCGTIFKLSANGQFKVIHTFDRKKSGYPVALVMDDAGKLYGTGQGRCCFGKNRRGSVFRLTPKGKLKMLYLFDEPDGVTPLGKIVVDSSGTVFGTTLFGGDADDGVIYQLNADGTEQTLHTFSIAAPRGAMGDIVPQGLIADVNGTLYGATQRGGSEWGTLYELVK